MDEWQLTMAGYNRQAPSMGAAMIDASVCADATCSKCGHKGMEYDPWRKPGSYRAFAVCPECGYAEEF